MYAYKQQTQERILHALPQNRAVMPQRVPKNKKIKKINPIIYLFRLCVILSAFCAFVMYVQPLVYNLTVKQILFNDGVSVNTNYKSFTENPAGEYTPQIDMYSMVYPLYNYLNNGMFNNNYFLAGAVHKKHSELSTMYQTQEIKPLKDKLTKLMAQYPSIEPSIFVWEYDEGKYVSINSGKMYSAASIIKLPVLVRMFKSIEANQFTIYDEMKFTEQYRASGSGNMQYLPVGGTYSMDYLAKVMIQDSDNSATNMIMSKLGGMDDVNAGLREWGMTSTFVKTWLPDLGGTNKTTAEDMANILYNLDNPGFLNVNSRESIIDYMSHVKNDRLIQAGLGAGALFIHKTGDIGTMLGDAGIVFAPNGKKYIVVILANRPYNSPLGKDFIVKASSLIYNDLIK